MASWWTYLIAGFLLFQLYAFVYVWAQAVAGWLLKLRIETISLGFGPRLWGRPFRGTDYRVSLVPWGGYTKFEEASFSQTGPSQRIVLGSVGPLSNLALAFLVLTASGWVGVPEPAYLNEPARVGWLRPGSPFREAGLARGDEILTVNYGGQDVKIESWDKLLRVLSRAADRTLRLDYRREGEVLSLTADVRGTALYDVCHDVAPQVGSVVTDSPAARSGFRTGDVIAAVGDSTVAVGDAPVKHWLEFEAAFADRLSLNQPLGLLVYRNTIVVTVTVPGYQPQKTAKEFGLLPPAVPTRSTPKGLGAAATDATAEMLEMLATGWRALRLQGEFAGSTERDDYEAVAQFRTAGGSSSYVRLTAALGLVLCLFNLVPLPPLNGGVIALLCVEKALGLLGVRLSESVRERLMQVGCLAFFPIGAYLIYVLKRVYF